MSCVYVVSPRVGTNWSIVSMLIASAAEEMGYSRLSSAIISKLEGNREHSVELEMSNSEVLQEQIRRGEAMVLQHGEMKIIASVDASQRLQVSVSGPESISKDQLKTEGQEFINRIIQQYAYQQVMIEMKDKGFSLVEEKQEADGRIRIRVRKYE